LALIYHVFGVTVIAEYMRGLLVIASCAALYAMLPWLAGKLGLGTPAGMLGGMAAALIPQQGLAEVIDGGGEALSAMERLLQLDPHPDGVFCYNDPVAMGAMKAILNAGLSIPEDIALIGCGNVFYSEFLRVPLSTVDQNSAAIGEQAAQLALSLIESNSLQRPKSILLEPALIARASTARKPAPSALTS
jgi:LacI family transcriptional regulator